MMLLGSGDLWWKSTTIMEHFSDQLFISRTRHTHTHTINNFNSFSARTQKFSLSFNCENSWMQFSRNYASSITRTWSRPLLPWFLNDARVVFFFSKFPWFPLVSGTNNLFWKIVMCVCVCWWAHGVNEKNTTHTRLSHDKYLLLLLMGWMGCWLAELSVVVVVVVAKRNHRSQSCPFRPRGIAYRWHDEDVGI